LVPVGVNKSVFSHSCSVSTFHDFTRADGLNGWHTLSVAGEGADPGVPVIMRLAADAGIFAADAKNVIDAVRPAVAHLPQ